MKDAGFKLKDKTAIVLGPVHSLVQAIASFLTDVGADVAMVDVQVREAQRFAGALTDAREIREDHGRAAAIEAKIDSTDAAKDVISRVAEMFGSIDIFIDARLVSSSRTFPAAGVLNGLSEIADDELKPTLIMTREVLQFLMKRQKGRVIYLTNERIARELKGESFADAAATGLSGLARALAADIKIRNLSVNCLSLGLTEEFLLAHAPKARSIEAARQEIKGKLPAAQIVEPMEVAQVVAFLASPLSNAVHGQTIQLG